MEKQIHSNIKLGLFVLAGLFFLILLLYMIGKNENLFGSTFRLRVQFSNVQGVTAGNNVRYAGIQAGTVKKVVILNDSVIEIVMYIESKMKKFIRKNAVVSIGTDGLMGNRVLNISAVTGPAGLVEENDLLKVRATAGMDEMMETLSRTNDDVGAIAAGLKKTVTRVNESTSIWALLNDKSLPADIRYSLRQTREATYRAAQTARDLQVVMADLKAGKGSLGALLRDSAIALQLQQALLNISGVGEDVDSLVVSIRQLTKAVENDLENGRGTAAVLLKDSVLADNLQESIRNVKEGTEKFSTVMEALKHNFLLRGYFRKLEKQKGK